MLQMKQMETNFKVGDRITASRLSHDQKGTIVRIEKNKIFALMDTTTTGYLTQYSLRKDNTFVAVGWSMDDRLFGGTFNNI